MQQRKLLQLLWRWETNPLGWMFKRHRAGYRNVKGRTQEHSVKRLESNLRWLRNPKELKEYLDKESHATLSSKLTTLAHIKPCHEDATEEETLQHVSRLLGIMDQLTPLIKDCSLPFRQKYITGTLFLQYLLSVLNRNYSILPKDMLIKAASLLSLLSSTDLSDIWIKLIRAIGNMPDAKDISLGHCSDLLMLLHNSGGTPISAELLQMSMDMIYQSVLHGISIETVSASLSMLHVLSHHVEDHTQLEELTGAYLEEIKNRVFCLQPGTLINILQFIYRRMYSDDELYTTVMEALLYKYNMMTYEEKSTLLLLLPFLKHAFLLQTANISTNVYSEECQMLNAALRREFEGKLLSMPLDDMVTHCLAISLMFRQNKVARKMLMASIIPVLVDKLDAQGFLKLTTCCNMLHITSSEVEVSRLLSKVATAKLEGCSGPDLLLGLKSLAQIAAKRHRKHLIPLVHNALEKNATSATCVIECLHLYVSLNMQRIDMKPLERGFCIMFPHLNISNDTEKEINKLEQSIMTEAKVLKSQGRDVNSSDLGHNLNATDIGDDAIGTDQGHIRSITSSRIGDFTIPKENSDVIYIPGSATVYHDIPLRGLSKLLECLTKVELSLDRIIPLYGMLQTSILLKIKYNSSVGTPELAGILRSLTESRIVNAELGDTILERIYRCPELLEDPETAAAILKFIEFTDQKLYATKLSKPLFEFCLRKPTPDLLEILEYQRYKRPEFYSAYVEMLQPRLPAVPDSLGCFIEQTPLVQTDYVALLKPAGLSRISRGKGHHILSEWLQEHSDCAGFEEYHQIDNMVLDFFHPKKRVAVLLLKPQDYNAYNGSIHLKKRMWLICSILRLKGIRTLLVPECVLKSHVTLGAIGNQSKGSTTA